MNPHDAAHLLAKALRESPEYKEFKDLKNKVEQNDTTRNMIKDFRKKQFAMQARQISGQYVSEEEIQQLQNLQGVLLQNPLVGPYLHAEYRVSQILNDVMKIINEAVDLELGEELKEIAEELKKEAEAKENNDEKDEKDDPDKEIIH